MSRIFIAHLLLLAVGVIYGLNFSIAKYILDGRYIDSSGFIVFRLIFGLVFFSILLWNVKQSFPFTCKEWWQIIAAGIFGGAANQLMFFKGLSMTSSINAALIMSNTPILVLILSLILSVERLTLWKALGILLGGFGATMLISEGFRWSALIIFNWGDVWVLGNALSYGIYLIIVRRLMRKYPSMIVLRAVFIFGLLFALPFGLEEALEVEWGGLNNQAWLSFAFVLLFTTGFTYWFNAKALETVNPSTVSVYIYVQPIVASIASYFIQQTPLNTLQLISGMFIFSGVGMIIFNSYLTAKKSKLNLHSRK